MIPRWAGSWSWEWRIGAVLAIAALVIWSAPVPKLRISGGTALRPPAMAMPPPAPASPDVSQLLARPLFTATRRPAPAPAAAGPVTAPVPTASTSGIMLLGVLHVGRQALALISLAGQPRPQLAALGANVGDWVVTKITNNSVTLQSGPASAELDLPQPAAAGTASTGLPPGFPPQPLPFNRAN